MSIPSVSISVHKHYTPEIRDRILGNLRASMDMTGYRMLTPAHLRALAGINLQSARVLSFYLQLTPDRRTRGAWESVFSSLSTAALKRISNRRQRRMVKDELDRIECALRADLPALGRGVAFFTCQPMGLWRQIAVSVPLPDGVHFGSRPYIRPLVRTRDEHDRFVLALFSQQRSRLFISQIGQVEEVFQVKGQSLRRVLADQVARTNRDGLVPDATMNEARLLARVTELVLSQFEGRYLLVSGPQELRAGVIENLSKETRQRLGNEFTADVHAGAVDIAAAAEPAQRLIEQREEVATLQRMIDAGPAGSVWGVQPTLDAVRERRVMTLAADDLFTMPGCRCADCGGLWVVASHSCPFCGSDAVETVEDVVEIAIEQALDQRAALELVRSAPARQLMMDRGSMAALLRW